MADNLACATDANNGAEWPDAADKTLTTDQQAHAFDLDLAVTQLQEAMLIDEPAHLQAAIRSLVKVMADAPKPGSQLSQVLFCPAYSHKTSPPEWT